jgi:hypothetical protein
MAITLLQICDAVRDTLKAAPSIQRWQSYDEMTESIPDTPLCQVYPEEGTTDPTSNAADRTTFKAGVRQSDIVIHVDLYGHRRANLAEDMGTAFACTDELITILEAQDTKPYFGLVGLKAFAWSWKRQTFVYDDPNVKYSGARFVLRFRIF